MSTEQLQDLIDAATDVQAAVEELMDAAEELEGHGSWSDPQNQPSELDELQGALDETEHAVLVLRRMLG